MLYTRFSFIYLLQQVPQENEEIFLNFSVLLDTTPPELFAIEIQDGGRLVWSSNGDYSLRLRHILIKSGGEMHIGSEECQFERKAKITLLGKYCKFFVVCSIVIGHCRGDIVCRELTLGVEDHSIHSSIRRSVRPSVRPFIHPFWFKSWGYEIAMVFFIDT